MSNKSALLFGSRKPATITINISAGMGTAGYRPKFLVYKKDGSVESYDFAYINDDGIYGPVDPYSLTFSASDLLFSYGEDGSNYKFCEFNGNDSQYHFSVTRSLNNCWENEHVWDYQSPTPVRIEFGLIDRFKDASIDIFCYLPCFTEDTKILLANGDYVSIGDLKPADVVMVWDFDSGRLTESPLLWLSKAKKTNRYQRIITNTGRVFNQVNNHRMFSITKNRFERCRQILGQTVWTVDGEEEVVKAEWVEKEVEYYNAISFYHMNLVTDGFLTSCGYNNLYPIKDMKYVKESRSIRPIDLYGDIPQRWYDGLRLSEHYCDPKTVEPYVKRCASNAAE